MKKMILSVFVMVSFGFYVFWQNINDPLNNLATSTPVVSSPVVDIKTVTVVTKNPVVNIPTKTTTTTPVVIPVVKKTGIYTDGEYVGSVVDAYYGNVQVKAIISGGKLVDVQFLDYPKYAQNSIRINGRAMPILIKEAIAAQSANVNAVSGASHTSPAFVESLTVALNQAKA